MEARIGAQRIIKTIGLEPEQLFITVRLISLFELGERFVLVSEADFDQHDFRERAATRQNAFFFSVTHRFSPAVFVSR